MKKMNSKAVVLLITIAVLLTATIGGTVAYLMTSTPTVTNVFEPGEVPPAINEEFDGDVKKNVTITNNGNVDAYIRAKIVVTWQDKYGNVYPAMPEAGADKDYTIELNIGTGETQWTKADGFYYYNGKVGAGASTGELIKKCKPVGTCPDTNYTLHIEIMAQAIQAEGITGATNAKDAWTKAAQNP